MKSTTTVSFLAAGVLAVSVYTLATLTRSRAADPAGPATPAASTPNLERVERGRYLVHRVGMCIDCHSPRDERGEFVLAKHLTGAPLGIQPRAPMPWMPVAPRIAGLPAGFSSGETVHFLMTGERPGGRPAPMPPYRMNREDAEAVTAYLASMAPEPM